MPTVADVIAAKWPAPGTETEYPTFGGGRGKNTKFTAEFHGEGDFRLRYGTRGGNSRFKKSNLDELTNQYTGLAIGQTSRIGAENVEEWISKNVTSTRLSSYVCTLLVELGYAVREGKRLRFKDLQAKA